MVRKNGTIQINSNIIKHRTQNPSDIITNKNYIMKANMIRHAYDNIHVKENKNELDKIASANQRRSEKFPG